MTKGYDKERPEGTRGLVLERSRQGQMVDITVAGDRRIAAYLSHSYRAEDRVVNEYFWRMLWDSGFTCTVDPPTGIFSAAHLELLVKRSPCVISVVTHRSQEPYYQCSPYTVYEHGLAVLGKKPRLAFVESGVSGRSFSETGRVCEFERDQMEAQSARIHESLATLREDVGSDRLTASRLAGKIGMVLGDMDGGDRTRVRLEAIFEREGYQPVPIALSNQSVLEMAMKLDELDFIVIDVTPGRLEDWIFPFVYGRSVPSLRLLRSDSFDLQGLDALAGGQLLRGVPAVDELVVSWRDEDELLNKVEQQLLRLRSDQLVFGSDEQGLKYFRSRGRVKKKVFVSNANEANSLAKRLSAELDLYDIEHFHYQYQSDAIPIGADWQAELVRQVQSSDVFVALVTAGYWHSRARSEFEIALGEAKSGMQIVPYFLDDSDQPNITQQGRDLSAANPQEQVETIVRDVDALLGQPVEAPSTTGRPARRSTDIAIVTVLPEEYHAVLAHLDLHVQAPAGRRTPRQHAWELGTIRADGQDEPYQIVVARAAEAGTDNAAIVCKNTIARFQPRYVLLVGVAGALDSDGGVRKGDVVVAKTIYGYEYGKIDGGFQPRHDYTFPVDPHLHNEAEVLAGKEPDWHRAIATARPGESGEPQVHSGVIGSGDKIIDDLSDPFVVAIRKSWPKLMAVEMEAAGVAAAVRDATASRGVVGLAVIRGISDTPPAEPSEDERESGRQTRERDAWKAYASEAAAVFATRLIRSSWPVRPKG